MTKYLQRVKITMDRKDKIINKSITDSRAAADLFRQMFPEEVMNVHEQCCCIFMNQAGDTVGWFVVSQGGITEAVVDVRMIFSAALNCLATSFFIAHNHPSGRLIPSESDKKITKQLVEGGNILRIKLLDHLILTDDSYYSFADEGLL